MQIGLRCVDPESLASYTVETSGRSTGAARSLFVAMERGGSQETVVVQVEWHDL